MTNIEIPPRPRRLDTVSITIGVHDCDQGYFFTGTIASAVVSPDEERYRLRRSQIDHDRNILLARRNNTYEVQHPQTTRACHLRHSPYRTRRISEHQGADQTE
jgi:hypothetical protein